MRGKNKLCIIFIIILVTVKFRCTFIIILCRNFQLITQFHLSLNSNKKHQTRRCFGKSKFLKSPCLSLCVRALRHRRVTTWWGTIPVAAKAATRTPAPGPRPTSSAKATSQSPTITNSRAAPTASTASTAPASTRTALLALPAPATDLAPTRTWASPPEPCPMAPNTVPTPTTKYPIPNRTFAFLLH